MFQIYTAITVNTAITVTAHIPQSYLNMAQIENDHIYNLTTFSL